MDDKIPEPLPADADIDALVSEIVFNQHGGVSTPWSKDGTYAYLVVEAMRSKGLRYRSWGDDSQHYWQFRKGEEWYETHSADKPSLAICWAAIAAVSATDDTVIPY